MPDTADNQEAFPQLHSQAPGVGFPIARCCTVVSLATACVCDMAIGRYEGKGTGENALLRDMLDTFDENDVAVFDRYYCSFMMLAMLSLRGVHVCSRLHQLRKCDCKTPAMVRRELWVTLLAYNLIRKVIATSAAVADKQPRCLGFTLACQTILSSWMLMSTGSCSNSRAMYTTMLAHIAANEVANRPGRIEPPVLKRRRHRYPLIRAYFERVQHGDPTHKKIALVATAHYLVRVMQAMLRTGECWRFDQEQGQAA